MMNKSIFVFLIYPINMKISFFLPHNIGMKIAFLLQLGQCIYCVYWEIVFVFTLYGKREIENIKFVHAMEEPVE